MKENISPDWVDNIIMAKNILLRGREAYEQINILGDDGVPIDYHQILWKSEVIDFVILQQDAFDKIDASTPIERQSYMMNKVLKIYNTQFEFESFEEVNPFYKRIINVLKQMNYSEFQSEKFKKFEAELQSVIKERESEENQE
jgi:V/A-type H+-transporting ATPase subunit A